MDEEYTHSVQWRVVGRSVMGASHTRLGKPNQDALGWQPDSGVGTTALLAVADGHGSAKCFRSERGSRLAVETALDELASLLAGQGTDATATKRLAQERLPQTLVRRWRQRVDDDLAREPLTDGELQTLAQSEGAAAQRLVAEQPVLAYGSTLLAAVATPAFLLYVQIGDGDILTVSDVGGVSRPVAGDARLVANETTSLCTAEAWKDFRVTFQPLAGSPPALIVLSSDGYANSFQNESAFLQVGQDLHGLIAAEGLGVVADNLAAWLAQASQEGSGDDVTVGVLARADFEQSVAAASAVSAEEEPSALRRSVPDRLSLSSENDDHRRLRPRARRPPRRAAAAVWAVAAVFAAVVVLLSVWAFRVLHPPRPKPPVHLRKHHSVKPAPAKKPSKKKSSPKTPRTIPVDTMIPPASSSP